MAVKLRTEIEHLTNRIENLVAETQTYRRALKKLGVDPNHLTRFTQTHCVYLIQSIPFPFRTYVGLGTVESLRVTLNRHNRLLSSGLSETNDSAPWKLICYISGFPDRGAASYFQKVMNSKKTLEIGDLKIKQRYRLGGRLNTMADILKVPGSFKTTSLKLSWVQDLKDSEQVDWPKDLSIEQVQSLR